MKKEVRKMPGDDVHLPEILLEMQRVGNLLRVMAMDPITGIEVVLIADPASGETAIKRLARRKLAYVIAKKRVQRKGIVC